MQVGLSHELDYARATQAMLRLAPDYVLIGEVRNDPA
ncbi:hypothetical protein FMN52_03130 [Marinobacter sp. BW6]|nr:ATPase, T2SS/T4P/T4SS family [Marinobacter sp. BW6]TYC62763.1 hypothetical protein FMN52_03130 [Marinobacter sp. BW6]